jgi:hypothetical protein
MEDGWETVRPVMAQQFGGVDRLPTTFLVDRAGRVAAARSGIVERKYFAGEVRKQRP